jgi:Leucine-rich repeat (LRR) protein
VDTGDAGIYTLRVTNSIATQLTLTSHPIILFQNQLPIYQALEAFYNSTGGPNWYNKNNWLSNQPITTWYGINVSSSNGLIYLSLYDNNLIGSLPEEFGNLSIFYLIQLSNNPGLTGEIPTSIGQLTNLQYLYLENNKLTGNIPAEIKNCGKLRYFYFNRNEIKNLPPDLTGLDLYGANTSNNKLEFDDIITWIGKVRYGFTYSPQKKYGEVESKPLIIGNSLTFNGLAGGDGNIYQWYQNNEIMPGQTGSELVFETLTAADEGTYECRVTNPAAPNLTLISEPKSLYDASNLDAYEPDNYFVDAQEITGADYQQRSLFPAGDRDIAWFEITQPSQVKIWMSNGSWGSRQLSVYATDTTTVLASGSDYATLFVIEPGIYYAKAWSQNSEVISEYFLDIEITPVTIDQYEPDNTWEEAKQIYPFFPQDDHNLKPFNDVDYVKIQIADAPRLITVDVYNETQCRNFNLWLYDTDGTSELAFSSSGAKNCGARVQYNIPSNGTYYIKTKVPWQEMYDYYTISVTTDGQPPVVKCNAQDSLALVAIYNATNGPNWGNKTNWLTGNVQTWYGVTMNMDGRVTGLNLAANRLNGYVPAEIGNITELKKLILGNSRYVTNYYSSNTLNQQPLPQTLANLTKLEILALDQLWMYNELPDIFSGMTGLRELYINNNYFSNQSLPVGIASCSNLGILYIYNNNFYDLPDLTGLSKLSNLQATGCYFAFDDIEPNLSIPGFYYSSQRLILGTPESINPVTGETVIRTNEVGGANNIYQWYKDGLALDGQTTNTLTLENVDTGDAGIYTLRVTNSIATQLTLTSHPIILYQNQLPIYQALDAFYNSTGGPNWYNKNNWLSNQPITTWYGININSSNGLIYLSLYDNNLIGSLPEEFGDLSIFYLIQIYYNPGLTGEIPESVGQLSNLQSLYIVNNNLTGEIPSSIGQLTNLQSLYLFNNKLSGNVPAEIGNMSQLYYFYIYGNQIEHLPNEITNCNRLRYFLFNNNKISDLPNLAGMDYLYRVHAHNNKLEFDDIIPLIGQFNQFEYASQDSIGESVVYNKTTGEYFSHSLVTGGQGNQYQWYKEGILLDGQTNATITFNTLSTDNSGYYFCTVTNPAAPKLTLYSKVIYLSVLENNLCPQHFHTVWEGTSGVDHMNINVLDAKMDGVDLESGDEIGVFDGDLCVGYGKVFKTIDQQNILTINVSRDEGSGNGFTQGNEIFYKFWDCSTENEIIVNNIQCFNTKGEPVTCLPFESMSSSFVKLSAISDICQTLNFNSGWNITSIPLTPESDDLVAVFQPLISNSSLVKIMNEEGNSLEDWGIYGGWKNFIGKVSPTEGYKVKLSKDDNFEICGTPVKYPFAIPLKSGWNIMGYPQTEAYDALEVLKQLINEGKLVKVQDEGGFSIEDWGIYGGWKNNIGDFVPGKGYNIKLNADASLWINESYPKSTSIQPEFIATTHFKPAFTGNGLDHININLVGLPLNILQIGDELAVFDGTTCVGAVTLTSRNISNQSVSIAASAKDNQGMAGFTEGNPIMLKLWNSKQNTEYTLEPEILKGSAVFTKHETTFASLEKYATTSVEGIAGNGLTEINCYPNPFSDEVTIEIKLVKDSKVHVEVLNQIGQRVKFLQNEKLMNGGVHRLKWDGKSADNQKVSTGIYHLRITVDDTVLIRKMVYSK